MYERIGRAFVVFSFNKVDVYIAIGQAFKSVFTRGNDSPQQPRELYKGVEILGPTVDSVNGANRQRRRKVTATPFNERNSGLVWKESLCQAQVMIKERSLRAGEGTTTTIDETIILALHVLASAGLGMSHSFEQEPSILPLGRSSPYSFLPEKSSFSSPFSPPLPQHPLH